MNYTTTEPNLNDAEQFKAAVLHPKKQNLTVETLVLPDKAADGMVRKDLFFFGDCIFEIFHFLFIR